MSTSDMSGDSGQYLSGLCTVQFLDEVVQRVDLPKKNEVTAQAVSFDWRRKGTNTEVLVQEEELWTEMILLSFTHGK